MSAQEQSGAPADKGACSDAVNAVRNVSEKSLEWGEHLWVAKLDVEKAFDNYHIALFHS